MQSSPRTPQSSLQNFQILHSTSIPQDQPQQNPHTIQPIPVQSQIPTQSRRNYSTNVPEYIELGRRPGTSVERLHQDCIQQQPGRRVTHLMHQLRQDCTRVSLPTLAHLCPPPTEKTHNPFNTVDPIPIPDPSQETRLTTSPPHICKHNSHQVSLQS